MKDDYVKFVTDLLSKYGIITSIAMFGGYGIYRDGVIIGIISNNELYFKADKFEEDLYKKHGFEQFTYKSKTKTSKMSYWKVPAEIMEDEEELYKWLLKAYNASLKK